MSGHRDDQGPIAWIGDPWAAAWAGAAGSGCWGPPAALSIPLDDRGLLLADGLFETLRVEDGGALLLEEHLARWKASADLLGLAAPPPQPRLEALIAEALARSGGAAGALRLNVSRVGGGRGLDPAPAADARFWLTYTPGPAVFSPLQVVLSRLESRNAASLLSRCKTFAYGGAIQARREARARGADDALLASSAGGLCCGSAATLLLRRGGGWLTPPVECGALPGVMRGRALALGLVREESLSAADLTAAEAALLINSLGCRPIHRFEAVEMPCLSPAEAEALWRGLIRSDPADQLQPCTEMR